MKKLFLSLFAICLFLTISGVCYAQTSWKTANQVTVLWDAVTVPSGTVTYKMYSKPVGGQQTYIETVSATQYTFTFTVEGRYILGVSSVRTVDGSEIESSTISWSDNPAVCQNGLTFGVIYYQPPAAPGGMR